MLRGMGRYQLFDAARLGQHQPSDILLLSTGEILTHQFSAALQQVDQLTVERVEFSSGRASGQNENLNK